MPTADDVKRAVLGRSMNPYVAFNNNPLRFVDPHGTDEGDTQTGQRVLPAVVQKGKELAVDAKELSKQLKGVRRTLQASERTLYFLSECKLGQAFKQAGRIVKNIEYIPMGKQGLSSKRLYTEGWIGHNVPTGKAGRALGRAAESMGKMADKVANVSKKLDEGVKILDTVIAAVDAWDATKDKTPLGKKLAQWRVFKNHMKMTENTFLGLFPPAMRDLAGVPFKAVRIMDPYMETIAKYALRVEEETRRTAEAARKNRLGEVLGTRALMESQSKKGATLDEILDIAEQRR